MTTTQESATMLSAGSTATLDLLDILSSCPSESLLSMGLDSLPSAGSSHSFDNAPPFPSTAKPLVFVNDFEASLLLSSSASSVPLPDTRPPLITSPTGPRLNVMMMENLSVKTWARCVLPQPGTVRVFDDDTALQDALDPSSWIPEGSMFSPDRFSALLRGKLSSVVDELSAPLDNQNTTSNLAIVHLSVSPMSSTSSLQEGTSDWTVEEPPSVPRQLVPTIMVSNSTAALAFSLESSHSLHAELPLAIRRGKKPPPTLTLGGRPSDQPCGTVEDPYPDIPTPFLGSPTTAIPIAKPFQQRAKFNMGLSAMCTDLRSRLPSPPPFSPTELVHSTQEETASLPSQDSVASNLDDDEWAFAKELVAEWHDIKHLRTEVSPPPSPAGDLPYTSDVLSPTADTEFDTSVPLLDSSSESSFSDDLIQTPVDVKVMRRKTVIIQAPDSASMKRSDKTEILSIATDIGIDVTHHLDDPVPFETPSHCSLSLSGCDPSLPTPPGSRPQSSASMRPVRGILKGKKSVRFSTVDMFHEYTSGLDGGALVPQCSVKSSPPEQELQAPARRVVSTNNAVYKCSPLRESYSPIPLAAAEGPRPRARAHSHATGQPDPSTSLYSGPTMAKHPALRVLARARAPSLASPKTPCPERSVGSGTGGAVVGAPSLHSVSQTQLTPPEELRRAPLRSINARQTMPARRRSDEVFPAKPTRASMLPSAGIVEKTPRTSNAMMAGARRVLRSTSIPPAARNERDENAARRRSQPARREASVSCGAPASAGKSRMSAPLRSIFTKLRT
ncbi:hypothetical protein BC628DRAFT_1336234 [Trametes gibbosa]|nr:hypothetical protein BC628DRAFT_1336234 [Trametes gibbosa]